MLYEVFNDVDYVLVLPHENDCFNEQCRTAFQGKLGKKRGVVIEGADAREMLALYSLYAFTDKIIIGSFCLPHGRKLYHFIESGIADVDYLINDVILGAL